MNDKFPEFKTIPELLRYCSEHGIDAKSGDARKEFLRLKEKMEAEKVGG